MDAASRFPSPGDCQSFFQAAERNLDVETLSRAAWVPGIAWHTQPRPGSSQTADPVSSCGFTRLALQYKTCFVSLPASVCPCIHSHLDPSPPLTLACSTPQQADLCVLRGPWSAGKHTEPGEAAGCRAGPPQGYPLPLQPLLLWNLEPDPRPGTGGDAR